MFFIYLIYIRVNKYILDQQKKTKNSIVINTCKSYKYYRPLVTY